jgi:hypothetical protein
VQVQSTFVLLICGGSTLGVRVTLVGGSFKVVVVDEVVVVVDVVMVAELVVVEVVDVDNVDEDEVTVDAVFIGA